jgi:hypothetical protein
MTEAMAARSAPVWSDAIEAQLAQVEARLVAELGGGEFTMRVLREHMAQARHGYSGARVHTFLPILIERELRRRLHGRPPQSR